MLALNPCVFDVFAVHVHVPHSGCYPLMPKYLLDGQQIHSGPIELRGAVVPQHVRREASLPLGKVPLHRFAERRAQRLARDAPADAVGVATFRREQRCSGLIPAVTEMGPYVLDEPPQGSIGTIDERNEPLLGASPARAFAVADVQLAEPAQMPLDVVEVQTSTFVDSLANSGHQLRCSEASGHRCEFSARAQIIAPRREQGVDLGFGWWDSDGNRRSAAWLVDLVDRAQDGPPSDVVDLDLVAQLQVAEKDRQGTRLAVTGRRCCTP